METPVDKMSRPWISGFDSWMGAFPHKHQRDSQVRWICNIKIISLSLSDYDIQNIESSLLTIMTMSMTTNISKEHGLYSTVG